MLNIMKVKLTEERLEAGNQKDYIRTDTDYP